MKLSARNVIPGKVKKVKLGPVSAEVTLEVARGIEVVSVISATSAKALKLKKGKDAWAVIKASNVMVGVED
ncbi:MAG: TOBE domain-containing protein [Burkholderiales bacterium]|nr:TOBE domain-containing protein [Burkholderiales bacterium]